MSKNFKICMCPFEPPVAVAEGLSFYLFPPFNEKMATLKINPNISDYKDVDRQPGIEIAQFVQKSPSEDTITVELNIEGQHEQAFVFGGISYSIKLMKTSMETREGQDFLTFEFYLDTFDLTDFQNEGTVRFKPSHEHEDWVTNQNGYSFSPIIKNGVFVQLLKNPDRTIDLILNGPLGHFLKIHHDISSITTPVLDILLTWKSKTITLYLNGEIAQEKSVD